MYNQGHQRIKFRMQPDLPCRWVCGHCVEHLWTTVATWRSSWALEERKCHSCFQKGPKRRTCAPVHALGQLAGKQLYGKGHWGSDGCYVEHEPAVCPLLLRRLMAPLCCIRPSIESRLREMIFPSPQHWWASSAVSSSVLPRRDMDMLERESPAKDH